MRSAQTSSAEAAIRRREQFIDAIVCGCAPLVLAIASVGLFVFSV